MSAGLLARQARAPAATGRRPEALICAAPRAGNLFFAVPIACVCSGPDGHGLPIRHSARPTLVRCDDRRRAARSCAPAGWKRPRTNLSGTRQMLINDRPEQGQICALFVSWLAIARQVGCRIASPELLPCSEVLPHSNCSPTVLHRWERIWGKSAWRHETSW